MMKESLPMIYRPGLPAGRAGIALILSAVAMTQAAIAQDTTGHASAKLLSQAKIDSDAARTIALQTQAGVIRDWELEKEAGGSGLRYSFDIESGGIMHEVGVDAVDGKILENVVETAADEAREAQADKAVTDPRDDDGEQDDDN
jgi:hypothetical protein